MSEAPNIEQQAREMGWVPKEEYKGRETDFIDADTFIQRTNHVMPFLKKTNEGLRNELTNVRGEVSTLKAALDESRAAMKEFTEFQTQLTQDRVKAARKELLDRLADAKENKDVGAEVQLTDELSQLNAREAAAVAERKTAVVEDKPPPRGQDDPVFQAWAGRNPWYLTDTEKQSVTNGLAMAIRKENPGLVGQPFLDELDKRVARIYPPRSNGEEHREPSIDRVSGGRHTGNFGGGSVENSYASLPSDAKQACMDRANRFVGENKPFKDLKAWQDHYAAQYYA